MDMEVWGLVLFSSILSLGVAAALGLIPANIAKKKGYSFGIWWFYGWMLFIVAIIHVLLIPDKNDLQAQFPTGGSAPKAGQSPADELKKYKELLDQGAVTPEEFQTKKEQLLKLM